MSNMCHSLWHISAEYVGVEMSHKLWDISLPTSLTSRQHSIPCIRRIPSTLSPASRAERTMPRVAVSWIERSNLLPSIWAVGLDRTIDGCVVVGVDEILVSDRRHQLHRRGRHRDPTG